MVQFNDNSNEEQVRDLVIEAYLNTNPDSTPASKMSKILYAIATAEGFEYDDDQGQLFLEALMEQTKLAFLALNLPPPTDQELSDSIDKSIKELLDQKYHN